MKSEYSEDPKFGLGYRDRTPSGTDPTTGTGTFIGGQVPDLAGTFMGQIPDIEELEFEFDRSRMLQTSHDVGTRVPFR